MNVCHLPLRINVRPHCLRVMSPIVDLKRFRYQSDRQVKTSRRVHLTIITTVTRVISHSLDRFKVTCFILIELSCINFGRSRVLPTAKSFVNFNSRKCSTSK